MPEPTNLAPKPEPNEKLVKIFDTEQENEAIVVQAMPRALSSVPTGSTIWNCGCHCRC